MMDMILAITVCLVSMATVVNAQQDQCTNVETFNAGLIGAIPDQSSRLPRIISALKNSKADFVCLQEVWMETDLDDLVKGVKSTFPHHFSAIHAATNTIREPETVNQVHSFLNWLRRWWRKTVIKGDVACNSREAIVLSSKMMFCGLINGCLSKSGYQLGRCMTDKCGNILKDNKIRTSCISCIFLNALNSLPAALKICSIPTDRHNRFNAPGLLVLSKKELGDVTYNNFFPEKRAMFERGYISAELPNRLNSICTHLSSNVEAYLEYDLSHGTYEQQQEVEIGKLAGTGAGVIIGDLNTGPHAIGQSDPEKNQEGEFTDNFDSLISLGFRSPYVNDDGRCTYCTNNRLTNNNPNQILDHVMVKTDVTTSDVSRRYDGVSPPLSDHYGVGMKVCWGAPPIN